MIKALIVDDEKLVRKGMISIMPWEKHGIQIVGDVNSGIKALEFLCKNEVELIITDMSMPEMSGIELIKSVKKNYPNMLFVVLTFYQEFEYVQEALRLGAIDYILKTSLEKEQLDDILSRITNRIKQDEAKYSHLEGKKCTEIDSNVTMGLVLTNAPSKDNLEKESILDWLVSKKAYKLDDKYWFIKCEIKEEQELNISEFMCFQTFNEWIIVKVQSSKPLDLNSFFRYLAYYKNKHLFYEYSSMRNLYEAINFDREVNSVSKEEIESLRKQWSDFKLISDNKALNNILAETIRIRPEINVLEGIVYSALKEWQRFLHLINIDYKLSIGENFICWEALVKWVREFQQYIQQKTIKPAYSLEINASIMKAVQYLNNDINSLMKEDEIAKLVGISRSYFSKAFRDIVGKPFNEFLLDIKMEKAKIQLLQTDRPIYLIAENIGYMNEKHFSRVFNKHTGILPSEYRNKAKGKQY